jgi:hypothetical protein
MVAGTFPASRAAVEKIAAAKANARPTDAIRKRNHAPEVSARMRMTNQCEARSGPEFNVVSLTSIAA